MGKSKSPSEMFKIGEDIEVIVIKYDKENNRISLGLKQLTDDLGKTLRTFTRLALK